MQLPVMTVGTDGLLTASIPSTGVLTVYAIPEPSTLAVLLLGGLPLLRHCRHGRSAGSGLGQWLMKQMAPVMSGRRATR